MRVLVTGSSGQLGSYVCEHMYDGHDVLGFDLLLGRVEGLESIIGDVRRRADVREAVAGVEVVVHCAAQVSVERSMVDPVTDAETNVIGTINMLHEAAEAGVRRFVYLSSAAVLGDPRRVPIDEEHPTEPTSNYGASKLAGERFAVAYASSHEMEVVAIRPFNFYSERADPDSPYSGVITKFTRRVAEGKPPLIEGDGLQTRDFIHAKDVAAFVGTVAEAEGHSGQVFNCGTGDRTSVLDLARLVISIRGLDLEPEHVAPRTGDIRHSVADMKKTYDTFGFVPRISLREGLEELLS
ncbi:MAG: NAD-dependent epimerase/dehydratase family protein [Methanobacteriota archaeon]|nr:MAG: NAD-dependent epimerase/dehydratase family protein [Euryarchaeota archaeon]